QQGGVGVAQVVEADAGQAVLGDEPVESTGDVLGVDRPAVTPGEHQPLRVEHVATFGGGCLSSFSVAAERVEGLAGDVDGPSCRAGLHVGELQVPADLRERPADGDGRAVEVDVVPAQRQHLTPPHAG